MQCHRAFISQTGPFLSARTPVNKQMNKEKTKTVLTCTGSDRGSCPSKIASTCGSDFVACLFPPFQRKCQREKLLRTPEPRTVHITVLHNGVAGKQLSFNTRA